MSKLHPNYPASSEVDEWCAGLLREAEGLRVEARLLDAPPYEFRLGVRHTAGCYVAFESPGRRTFYGFWQPCPSGRGPVLFHLPGYGAEMSAHPELVTQGYNVLHINPLGYATPTGPDASLQVDGQWPVLPRTARSPGKGGYVDWLTDAILAVRWAMGRPGVEAQRYAFFGSSQGGGTALLLASIFAERGVGAVAADVPFLIDLPRLLAPLREMEAAGASEARAAWKALGCCDVLCHAHRLRMPVLLTAAGRDETCAPEGIRRLFDLLPGTRSFTLLAGQEHGYTAAFLHLAAAWFRLYV